jgi:malate dehydrogenase (oxaloacetate-decarboxylating)(NADP+)
MRSISVARLRKLSSFSASSLSVTPVPIRSFSGQDGANGKKYPRPLRTRKHGIDIVHDPLWNKSLAFDMSERDRLGLRGLFPPTVRSLEFQVQHNIEAIRRLPDDVSKNLYLQELHNRNETLYHRVLIDYVSYV